MGQINLNNFKVITDKSNTFFVDNKFMVASEIPTTGEFKVGDIIINNGPTNVEEPMWICIEAGNPGTWTVFNSGGGSAGGGRLSTARNRVVLNGESKSEISIGVSGFNKASDVLMVFINSRFMTEGVDYEINADSTKIVAIGEVWNEELASEFEIEMIVFKMMGEEGVISSVNEIVKLRNTVIVNESVNEVEIGIEGFNEGDDLTVYRNSVYMIEGIDYEIQGNKIVSLKGAWNAEGGSDYKFTFEVLKTVAKVNPDAVVGMEHLTEDVKEAIEAAGNIDLSGYAEKGEIPVNVSELANDAGYLTEHQDLSGYATKEELNNIDMSGKQDKVDNSLVTNDKSIVGAINELFQSGVNMKQQLVDMLASKDVNFSTSASWSELIQNISTLKKYKFPDWYTVRDSNVWISGEAIPALIGNYGTVTVNGIIHCINNNQHLCYDIKTNSYNTTRAIIPTARNGFIMENVGDKIYCIGGSSTISNNDCYDVITDTWTTKTVTPKPLAGVSGAAIGNIIYQMGGIVASYTYNKTVHAYDTSSDAWTTKTSLPRNCSSSGSDSIGNFIYVFGGQYSSGSDTSNTIYCYDSTTDTWTTKAATIYSSRMTYTAAVNGKLYCMGGMNSNGSTYLNLNYCYDPSEETVTAMEPVPTTLCSLGGYRLPKVDNYICVIGGSKATAINNSYGRLTNDIFIP